MESNPQPTDEALVREHLAGSTAAFDAIVGRYATEVVAAIERTGLDHHRALDVAQEVFISLHAVLPRYRFEGKFRSMVFAMAMNRARDAQRSERRSRLVFLSDAKGSPAGAVNASHDPNPARDRRASVEAALGRVPPKFRKAVYLRDVVGLRYDELADSLGVRLGTAKSRVNRGRLLFRDAWAELEANGGEPRRRYGETERFDEGAE